MRTQLLHVVPAIDHEEDCDCDTAANDDSSGSAPASIRPVLSLEGAPHAMAQQPVGNRDAASRSERRILAWRLRGNLASKAEYQL